MLESIESYKEHLLRLTWELKVAHKKTDRLNALLSAEIMKSLAAIFGRTEDYCTTHFTVITHLLQCGGNHRALKTVELAAGQVTDANGISNATQENR